MRIAAIALCLTACFSKPPRPGDDPPTDGPDPGVWLEGFSHRRLVELDTGLTGLTTPLTNVPVVVNVRGDQAFAAGARSDGADIVATLDSVTLLPSEVASFTSAGDLELWVELPELGATASFYVYYGGDATATTSPWNPTRFADVWHLSESGDSAPDSTGRTALAPIGTVGHDDLGAFGGARVFGSGSSLGGGNPSQLDFGTGSFSYSLWVNQTANNDLFDIVLYKGGAKSTEPGFCFLVGSQPWSPKVIDTGGNFADPEVTPVPIHNRWVHLAGVVERPDQLRAYLDGVLIATDTTVGPIGTLTTSQPFAISRPDIFYTGAVDEVRIYNGVLEDDWIRLEHTMGTSAVFSHVFDEEP